MTVKNIQKRYFFIKIVECQKRVRHIDFVTKIVEINKKKIFNLAEAESILPIIFRMTENSSKKVKMLINQIEAIPGKQDPRVKDIEEQINVLISEWQRKIESLGLRPKGLWLADFDNGKGYFCWKYPETKIQFFHGYKEGFSSRKYLADNAPTLS